MANFRAINSYDQWLAAGMFLVVQVLGRRKVAARTDPPSFFLNDVSVA
jgi:hypothetical protein